MPLESTSTERQLTLAEAVKLIRDAKTRHFSAMVYPELPIASQPGKCFPGCATIKLSRPAAIKYATDLLSATLEDRGARLKITEYRSGDYLCIYIG